MRIPSCIRRGGSAFVTSPKSGLPSVLSTYTRSDDSARRTTQPKLQSWDSYPFLWGVSGSRCDHCARRRRQRNMRSRNNRSRRVRNRARNHSRHCRSHSRMDSWMNRSAILRKPNRRKNQRSKYRSRKNLAYQAQNLITGISQNAFNRRGRSAPVPRQRQSKMVQVGLGFSLAYRRPERENR